jgi:sugar phosphate isomerase/epimerase
MPRPVILASGAFADLPFATVAAKAAEWGYAGLELCCRGDHFDARQTLANTDYAAGRAAALTDHDLQCPVIDAGRVGQAVCEHVHEGLRHQVPDHVWGDGDPEGVRERAAAEIIATARAAQALGAGVVCGCTGSPLASAACTWPPPSDEVVANGYRTFANRWHPVLDGCREAGVRLAATVQPGQIAFDYYSAERALDAVDGREEFGFVFDPTPLYWQGVDPVAFLRRFADRIYDVHVTDAVLTLDGRSGVLGSLLPAGDVRRGWQPRTPGRGGIDWDAIVRGLNEIGYDGPIVVDWSDPGLDREFGAEDACKFVKQIDLPRPPRSRPAFGNL